ncbi:MAG: hypothetical protein ABSA17_03785 [Rhabdochlamydiaceae bacterium]|jgi:hypothetical protein
MSFPFRTMLDDAKRTTLCKELRAEYEKEKSISPNQFNKDYREASAVFRSEKPLATLSPEQLQIFHELNNRACGVNLWKNKQHAIEVITMLLPFAAIALNVASVVPAGTAFFYLRSHRSLAVASACSACACLFFASTCYKLQGPLKDLGKIINELKWENFGAFFGKVEGAYNELRKTSYLARFILNAQEKKLDNNDRALRLFGEHLSALQAIICVASKLKDRYLNYKLGITTKLSSIEDIQKKVDLAKILSFFVRFEKICQKGLYGTATFGLVALAWAYYAYVQKAYLMTIAGIVHFAVASTISRELYIFQRGSKNIFSVQEDKVAEAFQEMAARSMLFWAMDLEKADRYQIQNTVVIPFDTILKLIPSWKDPVQVK